MKFKLEFEDNEEYFFNWLVIFVGSMILLFFAGHMGIFLNANLPISSSDEAFFLQGLFVGYIFFIAMGLLMVMQGSYNLGKRSKGDAKK